jgi:hypothetical protein
MAERVAPGDAVLHACFHRYRNRSQVLTRSVVSPLGLAKEKRSAMLSQSFAAAQNEEGKESDDIQCFAKLTGN